jgi:predicted aminopeptidase
VFAAPEFSMEPRTWCYPVVGCVSYRGYFNENAARDFASALKSENLDVYVGGIAAYSTLGWFSDPVLNTLLNRQEHQLAALLFHELAHQVIYVRGDTEFNESFATAVEREGQRRWLETSTADPVKRAELETAIGMERQRQQQFIALVQAATADLRALYASTTDESVLREGKAQRFDRLRADYANLKMQWGGYSGYDAWFAGDLNNAKLATVSTYNNLVPGFTALLAQHSGDLAAFYQRVIDMAALSYDERRQVLAGALAAQ